MFINLHKEDSLELSTGKQYFVLDNQLNGIQDRSFNIDKNTSINYVLLLNEGENNNQNFNINLSGKGGSLDLRVLCLGDKNINISANIKVNVLASDCDVNFHTVALLADNSSINLDAGIVIDPGVINSNGYLLEENIILGENTKVKTLALLDIHSDDIKASHGVKIHRLDKEKLFYIQSKGVNDLDSKKIFVASYINKIFEKFEKIDTAIDIKKHILKNIKL